MLYTRSSQRFVDELRQFIADHYTGREQEGAYQLRTLQAEHDLMKNMDLMVCEEAAPVAMEAPGPSFAETPRAKSAERPGAKKHAAKKKAVSRMTAGAPGVAATPDTVGANGAGGAAKAVRMYQSTPREPDLHAYLRDNQSPTFGRVLVQMMVERGLEARDLYRRVFMDRRLFSKILSQPDYEPSKETALLLCLGLHLSVEEADDFLRTAGLSLSNAQQRDLAVRFFLLHQRYDVIMLNEMLLELGLKPLLRG